MIVYEVGSSSQTIVYYWQRHMVLIMVSEADSLVAYRKYTLHLQPTTRSSGATHGVSRNARRIVDGKKSPGIIVHLTKLFWVHMLKSWWY